MKLSKLLMGFAITCIYSSLLFSQTSQDVYENMCSKCHGKEAQGVIGKKAPALDHLELVTLENELFELKSGAAYQSSGSNHDVMEHNMNVILKKGYEFNASEMASYIYTSFNKNAPTSSVKKIYTNTCSKCHGDKAQGVVGKKAPPLNDKKAYDIKVELEEILNSDMNQSSGTNHDVMEQNQKKLSKKGMTYNPEEMAQYIEKNFYIGDK